MASARNQACDAGQADGWTNTAQVTDHYRDHPADLNLGYSLYGEVIATAESQPLLRREQVWRILQLVYPPHELEDLTRSDDKPAIAEAIRMGLAAMNGVWRERLAVPWTGGLATPSAVRRLADDVRSRAEELSFSDLPEDSCWILHQLPCARWAEPWEPPSWVPWSPPG